LKLPNCRDRDVDFPVLLAEFLGDLSASLANAAVGLRVEGFSGGEAFDEGLVLTKLADGGHADIEESVLS
jgi:hypothetical protein